MTIVTGGAGGIGSAIASAFAREGASLVLADLGTDLDGSGRSEQPVHDAVARLTSHGASATGYCVDVTDRAAVDKLISQTVDTHGRLDAVINAAGNLALIPFASLPPETFLQTIDVHLVGTFNVAQAAARFWASSGAGGAMINIGSDAGLFGVPDAAAYAAAKAGIVALTLSCVQPFREFGATANVLIPQAATRMTNQIPPDDRPDGDRWSTGEFDAANVTPMAVYLASDRGRWLTGRIIGSFGYEVHEYSKPARIRSLFSDGPWSISRLAARIEESLPED